MRYSFVAAFRFTFADSVLFVLLITGWLLIAFRLFSSTFVTTHVPLCRVGFVHGTFAFALVRTQLVTRLIVTRLFTLVGFVALPFARCLRFGCAFTFVLRFTFVLPFCALLRCGFVVYVGYTRLVDWFTFPFVTFCSRSSTRHLVMRFTVRWLPAFYVFCILITLFVTCSCLLRRCVVPRYVLHVAVTLLHYTRCLRLHYHAGFHVTFCYLHCCLITHLITRCVYV